MSKALPRYENLQQMKPGERAELPCPRGCGGWTEVRTIVGPRNPIGLVMPCLSCRKKLIPDDVEIAAKDGGTLYEVDGYTYYRPNPNSRPAWKRLGLAPEFANLSLVRPGAVEDRRRKKNLLVPLENRKPGITYVTSDEQWDVVEALRAIIGQTAKYSILVYGNNGTGKSRLLYAAAQDLVGIGRQVFILRGDVLSVNMASKFDDKQEAAKFMVRNACEADVLVWDEFAFVPGAQDQWMNRDVLTAITEIVYHRYEKQLITLWNGNGLEAGLRARLGDAVWSRVQGSCQRKIFGLVGQANFNWRADGRMEEVIDPQEPLPPEPNFESRFERHPIIDLRQLRNSNQVAQRPLEKAFGGTGGVVRMFGSSTSPVFKGQDAAANDREGEE